MGTRAVFTFKDKHESFSVYQHYDSYPEYALEAIKDAKDYAWHLPRFEASDFSAAFIAANKKPGGGNIYLTDTHENHSDLEYRYEIEGNDNKIFVKVYHVEEYDEEARKPIYSLIEEINL
jgi:hypothetical protein